MAAWTQFLSVVGRRHVPLKAWRSAHTPASAQARTRHNGGRLAAVAGVLLSLVLATNAAAASRSQSMLL